LVEKNFRGNLPFDRNFIVICLSAEVRGRLPFGTNFVVVCFLFRARGNVLLKNGLHGQLPVNFKSAPGLPSARRASSVGVYRRRKVRLCRFPSLVNGKTRAVPIEGVLAAANRTAKAPSGLSKMVWHASGISSTQARAAGVILL
jgi:hypothetical protein